MAPDSIATIARLTQAEGCCVAPRSSHNPTTRRKSNVAATQLAQGSQLRSGGLLPNRWFDREIMLARHQNPIQHGLILARPLG
jgi:hypothetical protein